MGVGDGPDSRPKVRSLEIEKVNSANIIPLQDSLLIGVEGEQEKIIWV
jgi:hypothetical protein